METYSCHGIRAHYNSSSGHFKRRVSYQWIASQSSLNEYKSQNKLPTETTLSLKAIDLLINVFNETREIVDNLEIIGRMKSRISK